MANVTQLYGPRPSPTLLAPAAPLQAGLQNPLIAAVVDAHMNWACAIAAGRVEGAKTARTVLTQKLANARSDSATMAEFGATLQAIANQLFEAVDNPHLR